MPKRIVNTNQMQLIRNWLDRIKEKGKIKVEYEYNPYAQDIYGTINEKRFTIGGISLNDSYDDRILEYIVSIAKNGGKAHNNTFYKTKVKTQKQVINFIKNHLK